MRRLYLFRSSNVRPLLPSSLPNNLRIIPPLLGERAGVRAISLQPRHEALIKSSIKSIRQPHNIARRHNAQRFGAKFLSVQVVVKADQHRLVLMHIR